MVAQHQEADQARLPHRCGDDCGHELVIGLERGAARARSFSAHLTQANGLAMVYWSHAPFGVPPVRLLRFDGMLRPAYR